MLGGQGASVLVWGQNRGLVSVFIASCLCWFGPTISSAAGTVPSGALAFPEIEGYWVTACGTDQTCISNAGTAADIAWAESASTQDPGVIQEQPVDYCGTYSDKAGWGLWQITCGNSVPTYCVDYAMLDPWNNAAAAVAKYKGAGDSFTPWSTYPNLYKNSPYYGHEPPPATGLTDPGQYIPAPSPYGTRPPGTPSSSQSLPGTTCGPIMSGSPIRLLLDSDGQVWAKNTLPSLGGWTQETGAGEGAIAVGSDGTQMLLDGGGQVWAKTTVGLNGWTQETPSGQSFTAIATNGGVQMILDGGGEIWAMTGSPRTGAWTQETGPGERAIAVG